MKKIISIAIMLVCSYSAFTQSMNKKYRTIEVEIAINAPAEKVWNNMVKDYGAVSNWSPYVYSANYENGYINGVVGAERKCQLNEKGSRWVHEKIAEIDEKKMVMRNIILDSNKFPLNADNTQVYYRVKDNEDGTCTASYLMQFRAKPAIMGIFMKRSLRKSLENNLKGLKHYSETGEKVTPMNEEIKQIKKMYSATVIQS